MEEYRKVIKAQLMKEHGDKSAVLQEREAYADPRYIAHLGAIKAGRRPRMKGIGSCAPQQTRKSRRGARNPQTRGRVYEP